MRHLIADVGVNHMGTGTDYPSPWATTPIDDVMAAHQLSDDPRSKFDITAI